MHGTRILAACLLTALALAANTAAASNASAGAPCDPSQTATDPAGDQQLHQVPTDTSPSDILAVSIARQADGLHVALTLAGDPRGAAPLEYSYWVGFEDGGHSAGGNPPTWTFQGTTSYDAIETMYWDGPQSYPVEWRNDTVSFTIPWSSFDAQYGAGSWPDFGTPEASTSGPFPSVAPTNNPSEDWASYADHLVALPDCSPAPAPTSASGQGATGASGAGGTSAPTSGGSTPSSQPSSSPSSAPAAGKVQGPPGSPHSATATPVAAQPPQEQAHASPAGAALATLAGLCIALALRRRAA